MGAGACLGLDALPEQVDREAARAYAGERFDEQAFDAAAQDGLVLRTEIVRLERDVSFYMVWNFLRA